MRFRRRGACRSLVWVLATGCVVAAGPPARSAEKAPATRPTTEAAIDPRAAEVFRAASQYLTDAKSYTFAADVWEDVMMPDGRKAQRQKTVHVGVRRPDRMFVEAANDSIARSMWYDGKTFTLFNRTKNLYGTIDVPESIDKTVGLVGDKFAIMMPLSDLIVTNVYADTMKDVTRADYLGRQTVGGVPCHHLAFAGSDVDWEMWVEEGAAPLVRRFVITYRELPLAPQYTATVSDWNFDAKLPDYAFVFRPPEGAQRVAILEGKAPPVAPEETEEGARQAKEVQQPSSNAPERGAAPADQQKKD